MSTRTTWTEPDLARLERNCRELFGTLEGALDSVDPVELRLPALAAQEAHPAVAAEKLAEDVLFGKARDQRVDRPVQRPSELDRVARSDHEPVWLRRKRNSSGASVAGLAEKPDLTSSSASGASTGEGRKTPPPCSPPPKATQRDLPAGIDCTSVRACSRSLSGADCARSGSNTSVRSVSTG
ncbi:MAG: hypothetical protein DMG07_28720, partial [Acidobacteria bacterium]